MSQASQLNIYFVLPKEDRNTDISKDMNDAYHCVKQYKGRPQWVLPSFCLSHTPQYNDVFVFESFTGAAFEKLKGDSTKVLGAKCMLTCMSAGDTIPPGVSPVFTEGMRGLIVCCTGFDEPTKSHIRERVQYMGGNFQAALRSCVTHLVAFNNISLKAREAFKCLKKVMTLAWVDAVWDRSREANVRGSDEEFDIYISPLFHNLKVTTSGISKRRKDALKNVVTSNGGTFMGALEMNVTDILIIEKPEGDKFKAAIDWGILCVKPSWITECADAGKILPLSDYAVDRQAKSSTPKKGEAVNFTGNFSMVSAIEHEQANMTHVEESANVTMSQSVMGPPLRNASIDANAKLVEEIEQRTSKASLFLDGCNIFIHGFSTQLSEKLRKVFNMAGATRFDELCNSVTHIIVASPTDAFKSFPAHILPLDWVLESAILKKPAPIHGYIPEVVSVQKMTPASPLSKQGARLLSRSEIPPADPPDFWEDDDLMQRYHLSQQGEPLEEPGAPRVSQPAPSNRSQPLVDGAPANLSLRPSSLSSTFSQTNKELFHDLKFFLSPQISEEELGMCEKMIIQYGGTVVPKKFSGVPDYAVVPIVDAILTSVTAMEVVNLLFIKDCIMENRVMPVQYYHQPFAWVKGSEPLEGCVACVTKYVGVERDFVETVIETIGGIAQDILAKNPKNDILKTTHLICTEPSGNKYEGALRWGVPVVHHNWLLKCAELGVRVPEDPFLLTENKNITAMKLKPNSHTGVSANSTRENAIPKSSPVPLVDQSRSSSQVQKAPLAVTSHFVEQPRFAASEVTVSPINKALERVKTTETPKNASPDLNNTATPNTPLGACFGNENPSPGTRKRLLKWVNQGANFSPYAPHNSVENQRRKSTPVSELLSRQVRLLGRQPEDLVPDDSPEQPPAKRLHFRTESTDFILLKMKEIEDSFSKASTSSNTNIDVAKESDDRLAVVVESQPHTEIGWDDPSDRDAAMATFEKNDDQFCEPRKLFMFSSLSNVDLTKQLIERLGGKVSDMQTFDKRVTHLIAGENISRGEKLLCGVARGILILHPSYLEELERTQSLGAVNDGDFELGKPNSKFSLDAYKPNVREYIENGYYWRRAVRRNQKRAFHSMNFALMICQERRDDFVRLVEAGDGNVVQLENWPGSSKERLYYVCEPNKSLTDQNMQSFARRNICCVHTMFISDLLLRREKAIEDNLLPNFAPFWRKWQT